MRKLTLLIFTLAFAASANAQPQPPQPVFSEPFDMPGERSVSRIVQTPNGNTLLFTFEGKSGIEVTVFNGSHNKIAEKTIESDEWEPLDVYTSYIPAIFPSGDNITLFIRKERKRQIALYRLSISGTDGTLLKQDKIAENGEPFVERDPKTQAYAVLIKNDGDDEGKGRSLEVAYYDATDHELIRRSFENDMLRGSIDPSYLGMVVDGTKNVYICTYLMKPGAGLKLMLSRLNEQGLSHAAIDLPIVLKKPRAMLVFDRNANKLDLLTMSLISSSSRSPMNSGTTVTNVYGILLTQIDPGTSTVISSKAPALQLTSKYKSSKYAKDHSRFGGLPMDFIVNSDGTTTLLTEETVNGNLLPGMGTDGYRMGLNATTALGDIGITELDKDGTETAGYVIRKLQNCGLYIPVLSHGMLRNKAAFLPQMKLTYSFADYSNYSFDYISTPSARYIILNDVPENFEADASDKPAEVGQHRDLDATETVCYKIGGGAMSKFRLFGTADEVRHCTIWGGNYNSVTGEYASLVVERDGRKRQARIGWVHF